MKYYCAVLYTVHNAVRHLLKARDLVTINSSWMGSRIDYKLFNSRIAASYETVIPNELLQFNTGDAVFRRGQHEVSRAWNGVNIDDRRYSLQIYTSTSIKELQASIVSGRPMARDSVEPIKHGQYWRDITNLLGEEI